MHKNYCLSCRSKNCYNRTSGPKKRDCLEIDYKDDIILNSNEKALISKTSKASQKAFKKRVDNRFAVNWLVGFIKNFFEKDTTVGIAACLGAVDSAQKLMKILNKNNIKTHLVTCKLGDLTIDINTKEGKKKHPGCNPIAQAKILNKLKVPVVILVSLCIGHDMLLIKNCNSYVIPFITKTSWNI